MAEPKSPLQRQYPAELRDRAALWCLGAYERSQAWHDGVTRIAAQLGIGTESLLPYVKQAAIDRDRRFFSAAAPNVLSGWSTLPLSPP